MLRVSGIATLGDASRRILLVENEPIASRSTASVLGRVLGWDVDVARDGGEASKMFESGSYAVVVVVDGPGSSPASSGLEVCRRLRAESPSAAFIVVVGRDTRDDQIRAFEAGADYYLARPFDPELLMARAKAVVRRSFAPASRRGESTKDRPLAPRTRWLDPDVGVVHGPSGDVRLTRLELRLLLHCESSRPTALTSEAIAAAVLERKDQSAKSVVHRHVANIRAKARSVGLEDPLVRGPLGYAWRER